MALYYRRQTRHRVDQLHKSKSIPGIELQRLSRRVWRNWRGHMNTWKDESDKCTKQNEEVDTRVWRRTDISPKERFKKAIRQVRMICAVNMNLNKYANEAGHSMFAAHMPELLASTSTPNVVVMSPDSKETISFNRKDYKFNYEFKWPKKAEAVLEKLPKERTSDDISVIRGLMRGLHSFRKYTRESQNLICKVVRLERYGRRRVVVRKGHIGYAFYFVFSGGAGVTLDEDEGSAFTEKEVSILKKGTCFGELALTKDVRRAATIVCMEETELLAVDRDDFFNNGLHRHFEKEFTYRYDFFRKLDLFSSWSEEKLQELSDMGRIEEYNHDSVVVRDLRDTDWLLFVTKGRCDVLKLVDIDHCITTPIESQRPQKPPPRRNLTPLSFGGDVPMSLFRKSEEIPDPEDRGGPSPYSSTSPWITHTSISNRPKTTGQLALKKELKLEESNERSQSATVRFEASISNDKEMMTPEFTSSCNTPTTNQIPRSPAISSSSKVHGVQTFKTKDVQSGIYVKVDALRFGQCFGLEGVVGNMPYLSLVSCGCELIRVSMSKFKEYADEKTLQKVQKMISKYPTDRNLWSRLVRQSKWNNFKNTTIENIFNEKKTGRRTYVSRPGDNCKTQFVKNPFPKIIFNARDWASNVVPHASGKCQSEKLSSNHSMSTASLLENKPSVSSMASSTIKTTTR
ncbi:cyclic nucleotide-binding domain-containing protein 2-like [Antedon mediterranea]|uniref:cyclic nucleotide-binding domain-containing protein 2-like n=1 Tax=Antedon mediterranea TaxID=105859 RepID=UPI003AF83B77